MISDANKTRVPGSDESLPLQMVGILSALVFALNFSLEFVILTFQPQEHQWLLLALIICLAVWALAEAILVSRLGKPGMSHLLILLLAQLVVAFARAGLVIWPDLVTRLVDDLVSNQSNVFIFVPIYAFIFLSIARALLKIHTARLDDAYRMIVRMEASALKLTEAIPVGTYVLEVSPEGRSHFSFVSQRWLSMLAVDREAVLEDPSLAYRSIHPEDREEFLARNEDVIEQRRALYWEGRFVVAGKTRWMKIEAVPRLLRDGKTVYEGVMIDITSHNEALDALNRTHARIAQATIAQSRLLEREQLLQDMHDGFGSQLATARLMAEKGDLQPHELADILQQCMSDLLLFTDTLRNGDCNLADGLFDLRYRTVQRTAHLPLTWQWLIRLDPPPALKQRTVLHILRIVQEALSNALKHSGARAIVIMASMDARQQTLEVSVTDDGIGLPEHIHHGRGLRGMQYRAREIGAELTLLRTERGTTVRLMMACVVEEDYGLSASLQEHMHVA